MKNGQTTPLDTVVEKIPISLIDPFPHHPFYVLDDSEMIELIESIRKNGLITPIIVRRKDKAPASEENVIIYYNGVNQKTKSTTVRETGSYSNITLTRREANEFIVYWLPLMEQNPYNIISFQTDIYTDAAQLEVDPAPDTLIRVFMAWQKADSYVELPEQELSAPERNGFTVVEWGGTEINVD